VNDVDGVLNVWQIVQLSFFKPLRLKLAIVYRRFFEPAQRYRPLIPVERVGRVVKVKVVVVQLFESLFCTVAGLFPFKSVGNLVCFDLVTRVVNQALHLGLPLCVV